MNHGRSHNFFVSLASLALILFAAVGLSACTQATPSDTWEQPNQNTLNTRYSGGRISTNTINNVAVGWTSNIKAAGGFGADAPTPIITQDSVFLENASGNIIALNFFTGQPRVGKTIALNAGLRPAWLSQNVIRQANKLGFALSPVGTNTDVSDADKNIPIAVVGDTDGNIIALNRKNANNVWKRQIEAPSGFETRVVSNMAAANDSIFVPAVNVPNSSDDDPSPGIFSAISRAKNSTGSLVSLNAENGDVNWTKKLASAPLGGATVANNIVFVTTVNGNIYGFNRDSGDQVWTSKLPAGSVAPIAISDDTLIVPASLVVRAGQKAQVVAFRIGGLGSVGGAAAPKLQEAADAKRAAATKQAAAPAAAGPDGKTIFTANCAGCHTLKAAGTNGTVGPNLDQGKYDLATVTKQVINGGGPMPAFKGTLSPAEIKAVATFVAANDGS
jgi:mono/diheme cytochrome c family protein